MEDNVVENEVMDQASGQTPGAVSSGEQAQGSGDFITREEFVKELRKAQSQFDKAATSISTKVKAKLDQVEATLKYAGQEVTPEMRQALRQRIVEDALFEADQPSSPASANQPAQADRGDVGEINAAAFAMMKEAGIHIDENDPEAQSLDQTNAYKFFKSLEVAIEAKKQRLASSPKRTPTNLGGSGAPTPKATDQAYRDEMLANRGKGLEVARQIKAKYREAGVDVDRVSLT